MGVDICPRRTKKLVQPHSFCPRGTNSTFNQLVLEVVHEWQQLATTVPVADNPEDEAFRSGGQTTVTDAVRVQRRPHWRLAPSRGAAAPPGRGWWGAPSSPSPEVMPRAPGWQPPPTPWSSQGPWEPMRPHQTQQMLQGPEVQEHWRPMHQLRL